MVGVRRRARLGRGHPALRPGVRGSLVERYRHALDDAAAGGGAILVGGVSVGAHVAALWAAERSGELGTRLRGMVLALPAWTGPPGGAPAARAALATAAALRRDGLASTLDAARAGSPRWLADELARAWGGYGPDLAEDLAEAGRQPAPSASTLRRLDLPVGLVGLTDDPLHPLAVARHWRSVLPRAALVTSTLDALGADRATLGRAAVLAWRRAADRVKPAPQSVDRCRQSRRPPTPPP